MSIPILSTYTIFVAERLQNAGRIPAGNLTKENTTKDNRRERYVKFI